MFDKMCVRLCDACGINKFLTVGVFVGSPSMPQDKILFIFLVVLSENHGGGGVMRKPLVTSVFQKIVINTI